MKEEDTAEAKEKDTSMRNMATAEKEGNSTVLEVKTAVEEIEMKQKGRTPANKEDVQEFAEGELDEYYFQDPSNFGKVNVNWREEREEEEEEEEEEGWCCLTPLVR